MNPIVRNYSEIKFTEVDKLESPERYLNMVAGLLHGVKWCFAFGTALGLHREKGFIPCDTDIDVMILVDDVFPMDIAARFIGLRMIRTVLCDRDYHQIAFQADDGMIIDLCFFYRDGDNYISYCEGGYWKDPVDVIGRFSLADSKYGAFPVPEKIEEYLTIRYGDDWKVPRYGDNACSIKAG